MAGLNNVTVDIEQLYQPDSTAAVFWDMLIADSSQLLVELITVSSDDAKYEGFARVAGHSPSVEIDGVVDQGVTLQIDGELTYTTAQ